jgi:hypothetical protein
MTSRATKPILSIHRCHFSGFLAQYEPLEKTLFSHPCPPRHETWQSLLLSPNLLAITKGTSENYVNANVSGCLTKFISKMPIFCDASGIRLYRLQGKALLSNVPLYRRASAHLCTRLVVRRGQDGAMQTGLSHQPHS